jgi:hypothetical protein
VQHASAPPGYGSTVVEEAGSHSIYISQPQAVAALIAQAAQLARPATATL